MTLRATLLIVLAIALAAILAFGSFAHAFLPHQHSVNEAVTNLLHSALRHEEKYATDIVPDAPLFVVIVVASILPFFSRAYLTHSRSVRAPALLPLRRGIVPYRRFG